MKFIITIFVLPFFLNSCLPIHIKGNDNLLSHEAWTVLVKKHVGADGLVDYRGFIKDKTELEAYLQKVSDNPPPLSSSNNDKIAYWLNAYNAFTIKLIIDHYPVKSIKDLGGKHQVIFINTPWDRKFFKIGGKTMTLNRIEHRILRRDFTEPRIHFALNCASLSCPKLRREAYDGSKLDEQLTNQAREFLKDTSRNQVREDPPQLSAIFNFYGKDMTKWSGKSLISFINQYSPSMLKENVKAEYMDYNWNLNERK